MLCQENIAPAPLQQETRLRLFKNNRLESTELRRRRIDVSIELRKAKREALILKRRNIAIESDLISSTDSNGQVLGYCSPVIIEDIVRQVKSSDPVVQLTGVQSMRKLLSMENHSFTDTIIESGLVPKIIEFLSGANNELQFEAAWVLANIASGTSYHTHAVADAGALPYFIHLLTSPHKCISEQAVWAVANIAGDGPDLRDCVIRSGVISPLITLIRTYLHCQQGTYLRNIIWTLSNLCCHKNPPPSYETVIQLLPTLTSLLHHGDREVVSDICRIFSQLTDSSNDRIELVVNCGIIPRLVFLVQTGDSNLQEVALRTIGNIVTGKEEHVKMIIDSGVLKCFGSLLRHHNASIQKETAWALSNISAGPSEHIEGTIEVVQREAVWAVANMTAGGTIQQVCHLLQAGVLSPLCELLTTTDAKVLVVTLDAITNILLIVENNYKEQVCCLIEEAGGVGKIEALQQHSNVLVSNAALSIMERFYESNETSATAVGSFQVTPMNH